MPVEDASIPSHCPGSHQEQKGLCDAAPNSHQEKIPRCSSPGMVFGVSLAACPAALRAAELGSRLGRGIALGVIEQSV